jgi:phage shock protein A
VWWREAAQAAACREAPNKKRSAAMGILSRINTVIKSNLNSAIDRMTDPAKEIELLIVDMEKNAKQAKEEVISVAASAKRTAMRCDKLKGEVETWQRRAEQAVRAGDDELAREALRERQQKGEELTLAERNLGEQEVYVDQLKQSLKALEARVKEVKAKKETLKERARAAKEGRSSLEGGKAFKDFERLEDRIEALETEASLSESLDARDAATEAKFAKLEGARGDPKIEDALADLKRKIDEE